MAATKYEFSIASDFPKGKVEVNALIQEIQESNITIMLDRIDTHSDICDIWFKNSLPSPEETTLNYLIGSHQGIALASFDQIEVVNDIKLHATNIRGKLEVHESSRIPGTYTYYTGAGDDPTNIMDVGNGQMFILHHRVDDSSTQYLYLDFNTLENETWVHEGYMIWSGAQFDTITFEIVPRVTSVVPASNTYFNLYGGYLVVPAAGDGTIQVVSDITTHSGGLVEIPLDYDGNRIAPCFWNADWNTTTKRFENISAAPLGNGKYNMFAAEVVMNRFVNRIPVYGEGFEMMQSADADKFGSGMRFRARLDTSTPDHYWNVGCILTMHRSRSV
jgi:hypothetical protein